MISIQPYWVFLIIAKAMGWEIDQHKEIEVRKTYPKAEDWNRLAKIYCSKDKKSFDKIPEKYRPAMKKFLGKVIGHFVCDRIYNLVQAGAGIMFATENFDLLEPQMFRDMSCLTDSQLADYLGNKDGYAWHISDLVIYDEPRELGEFKHYCKKQPCQTNCWKCDRYDYIANVCLNAITRPPESWRYIDV